MITNEQLVEEEKRLVEEFNCLFRRQSEVQGELDSIVKRLVRIQGVLQFIAKLKQKSLPLRSLDEPKVISFPEVSSGS